MHVNLRKMQHRRGKLLILLTVALAIVNAQCFALCLVQFDAGASHCHPKPGHCPLQHDLTTGSARTAAPVAAPIALVDLPLLTINPAPQESTEPLTESPPSFFSTAAPLPLRI
jgi:hypothetical protein